MAGYSPVENGLFDVVRSDMADYIYELKMAGWAF